MTGGFSARRGVERVGPRTLMQRGVLPLLVELGMNVFDLRSRLVSDYRRYTRSFIKIRDERIKEFVDRRLDGDGFWPEPLLQLNPTFKVGGTIDDLVGQGVLPRNARGSSGSASPTPATKAGRSSCISTSARRFSGQGRAGLTC